MRVTTDIGGTFTDLIYLDNNQNVHFDKVDSTPPKFENGIMNAINKAKINIEEIDSFVHGSTVVINTITERTGAKVGLITTKGTRDILEIARANRPDLYNFKYIKPEPLVERYLRLEVNERTNYLGEIVKQVDFKEIDNILSFFRTEDVGAIAISFLHSYKNPTNERKVKEYILKNLKDVPVTASHELIREWREYERTNTTVLNSYVQPITTKYLDNLERSLYKSKSKKFIMQSNGGLTSFSDSKSTPINMIESGPVAGVFGASLLGKIINEPNIIAFDVGGTTAKCSLITNNEIKVTTDYYIEKNEKNSGYPVKIPVVDIVEIGNGGGSIAWIDELGSLKVGPTSAGSFPGPLSYGKGGNKVTTTDANLYLGRLSAENFSNPVDFEKLEKEIDKQVAIHFDSSVEDAALGIIDIANSNMLNALKLISVRKGYNPQNFALIAFGGGGPLHAAQLARDLGIKKVIVPATASVFSAWGMLMSNIRKDYIQTHLVSFNDIKNKSLNELWNNLEHKAILEFKKNNLDDIPIDFERSVELRYKGQEHTVQIKISNQPWSNIFIENIIQNFHQEHEFAYNFKLDNSEIELVNLHLTAFGKIKTPSLNTISINKIPLEKRALYEVRDVYFGDGNWLKTNVYKRKDLFNSDVILGPAIIEEKTSSTLILNNQKATIDSYGNIIIDVEVNKYE